MFRRFTAVAFAGLVALALPSAADEAGWAALRAPGTHALRKSVV